MSANRLKLMDKTELLWVGSKYNLSKLNGSGPSLQLCSSSPPLSTHVNMCACLVFSSCRIWVSTSTFPVSAVPASTSFANYDTSAVRLTRSLRLHSCTPSWRHTSITVMQCSPRQRRRQQTSSSACWMPLQGSSAIPGNMTKNFHDWCTWIYTGLTFMSESVTNFVCWHIDVSSGRLQCTCRTTARQHLRSAAHHWLVVPWHWLSTYGRQAFAVAGPMTVNALPMSCATPPSTQQLSDDF